MRTVFLFCTVMLTAQAAPGPQVGGVGGGTSPLLLQGSSWNNQARNNLNNGNNVNNNNNVANINAASNNNAANNVNTVVLLPMNGK